MRRVFISGSKGFIGSSLKDTLKNAGYYVIEENCNLSSINSIKEYNPDVIIHCAAIVGSVVCDNNPGNAADSNIRGSWEIAKVAKELGSYFVNMSSIAIYDFDENFSIITEESKIKPHTWYGMTKYLSEKAIESVFDKNEFLNIRLGFIYGDPIKDPHSMISGIIKNTSVPLVGKYYKDYLYINDCVEAIICLIQNRKTGTYNVGSGEVISTEDILFSVGFSEFAFDDFGDYYGNFIVKTDKIYSEINWEPKTNNIKKIKELKYEFINKK